VTDVIVPALIGSVEILRVGAYVCVVVGKHRQRLSQRQTPSPSPGVFAWLTTFANEPASTTVISRVRAMGSAVHHAHCGRLTRALVRGRTHWQLTLVTRQQGLMFRHRGDVAASALMLAMTATLRQKGSRFLYVMTRYQW
jgi:hypothetical protein